MLFSYRASVELDSLGYRVLRNHKIRLAVSLGYWPQIWPPRSQDVIIVLANAVLELPILHNPAASRVDGSPFFEKPEYGPALIAKAQGEEEYSRFVRQDLSIKNRKTIATIIDEGNTVYPQLDTSLSARESDESTIIGNDVLSARIVCKRNTGMGFQLSTPNPQHVIVNTRSVMSATREAFELENTVETTLNGEPFFSKTWLDVVQRKFV